MKKKIIIMVALIMMLATVLIGCTQTQADRVSYNVSQEADNFNVVRQLVVINAMTDEPVFELIGTFSFELNNDRIIAIVETGEEKYEKHSIGLPEFALWYVRDMSGAKVNKYQYELNFQPEMIQPFEVVSKD